MRVGGDLVARAFARQEWDPKFDPLKNVLTRIIQVVSSNVTDVAVFVLSYFKLSLSSHDRTIVSQQP